MTTAEVLTRNCRDRHPASLALRAHKRVAAIAASTVSAPSYSARPTMAPTTLRVLSPQRRDLPHVRLGADPAAGDHRQPQGGELREGGQRGVGDAGHHAVVGDVRADRRGDRQAGEPLRQLDRRHAAGLGPAVRRQFPAAVVEAEDQPAGPLLRGGGEPVRVLRRRAADDGAVDAQRQRPIHRRVVPHAPAELHRNGTGRGDDAADRRFVGAFAGAGGVEVHDVQPRRAAFAEPRGDGGGVVAEDGLAVVVALPQADALPAAEVDRGEDFEGGVAHPANCPPGPPPPLGGAASAFPPRRLAAAANPGWSQSRAKFSRIRSPTA